MGFKSQFCYLLQLSSPLSPPCCIQQHLSLLYSLPAHPLLGSDTCSTLGFAHDQLLIVLHVSTQMSPPQQGLPWPAHIKRLSSLFHLHHYSIHSTYHSLQLLFFCLFSSLLSASSQNECRDHVGLIQGFISGLSHWRALRSAGWSLYEPPAEPPPLPRSLLWAELISASMVPPLYLTHTLLTALAMLGCNCFSPCPATLLAHSSVRSGTESYLCIPKAEQWSWGRSRSSAT